MAQFLYNIRSLEKKVKNLRSHISIDEYGYTTLRLSKYFDDPKDFIAPANMWGDLGAASAPLLISLAMESVRKGYAKGKNNLIFTISPGGNSAAAILKLQ